MIAALLLISTVSNSGGIHIKASRCTFGQRQGHAGDVIAGAKWEMPSDSCITPDSEICLEAAAYPSAHTRLSAPWVTRSSELSASPVRISVRMLPCTLISCRSCPGWQCCTWGAPRGTCSSNVGCSPAPCPDVMCQLSCRHTPGSQWWELWLRHMG